MEQRGLWYVSYAGTGTTAIKRRYPWLRVVAIKVNGRMVMRWSMR